MPVNLFLETPYVRKLFPVDAPGEKGEIAEWNIRAKTFIIDCDLALKTGTSEITILKRLGRRGVERLNRAACLWVEWQYFQKQDRDRLDIGEEEKVRERLERLLKALNDLNWKPTWKQPADSRLRARMVYFILRSPGPQAADTETPDHVPTFERDDLSDELSNLRLSRQTPELSREPHSSGLNTNSSKHSQDFAGDVYASSGKGSSFSASDASQKSSFLNKLSKTDLESGYPSIPPHSLSKTDLESGYPSIPPHSTDSRSSASTVSRLSDVGKRMFALTRRPFRSENRYRKV